MSGRILLTILALVQSLATPVYDFDRRHIFNPGWPGHARYHAAAFVFLNMGVGFVALWLIWGHPDLTREAAVLLALSSLVMFLAAGVPKVVIQADGERLILGHPVSSWMAGVFLVLVAVGWWLSDN
ncbi:MAG: hypothetical protein HYR96_13465 [Deltaproteobacteria bacterium]|nr:hypothetical protein [Deltaproteobacteria bacterium]MBI3295589.1 hypothetical protein [Deltaproteobacteria bacterium]